MSLGTESGPSTGGVEPVYSSRRHHRAHKDYVVLVEVCVRACAQISTVPHLQVSLHKIYAHGAGMCGDTGMEPKQLLLDWGLYLC